MNASFSSEDVDQPGSPVLGRTIERIEQSGHRITAPRRAVLAAAAAAGDQFSGDEIAQRLPGIGRATVFRTLKLLVELNIFCRVLRDDGDLRYRWSRHGHHHHLVCSACGAVQDFTACDVTSLVNEIVQRTSFTVEGHWLEVYGRCAACTSTGVALG